MNSHRGVAQFRARYAALGVFNTDETIKWINGEALLLIRINVDQVGEKGRMHSQYGSQWETFATSGAVLARGHHGEDELCDDIHG